MAENLHAVWGTTGCPGKAAGPQTHDAASTASLHRHRFRDTDIGIDVDIASMTSLQGIRTERWLP
ncbi:hypothetical protein AB0G83_21710 [Streptomyces klenkii]|uniref:hypothetical protein n=1 Tax=Streptomyces TaxID=1883 RepID=UPI001E4A391A|nr:hypothetical protein [Streptomyces sp. NRRL B-1677]